MPVTFLKGIFFILLLKYSQLNMNLTFSWVRNTVFFMTFRAQTSPVAFSLTTWTSAKWPRPTTARTSKSLRQGCRSCSSETTSETVSEDTHKKHIEVYTYKLYGMRWNNYIYSYMLVQFLNKFSKNLAGLDINMPIMVLWPVFADCGIRFKWSFFGMIWYYDVKMVN